MFDGRFQRPARAGARHALVLAAGVGVLAAVAAVGLAMRWLGADGISISIPALAWAAIPAVSALAVVAWIAWLVWKEREEPDTIRPVDLIAGAVASLTITLAQGAIGRVWPAAPALMLVAADGVALSVVFAVVAVLRRDRRSPPGARAPRAPTR